jgi:hypothetical protein
LPFLILILIEQIYGVQYDHLKHVNTVHRAVTFASS